MLFRLLIFRMGPLAVLNFFKERNKLKRLLYLMLVLGALFFLTAAWQIFKQERWQSVWILLLSMFPQGFFYGFAVWMLFRCVMKAWSKRVWKRIYSLAFLCILCGILAVLYINPFILRFFVKFF